VDYEITCYVSIDQDLYHASHLYTGLCDLSRKGKARVRFAVSKQGQDLYTNEGTTVWLSVTDERREGALIAVDLRDRSDLFNTGALERCDLYLKRSYYGPNIPRLADNLKRKIVPFGLNYACRSRSSTARVLAALFPKYPLELIRSPRTAMNRIGPTSVLYHYLTTSNIRAFEYRPDEEVEPSILFQSRVYKPEHVLPDSPEEVNEGRVAVVRALRKAFGKRFVGGLVPTDYARKYFPDALSDNPTRQSQYITMSKRSLVGIYTRGLFHSLAFKLPEYLAASKCIVSEPLRNQLPVPLVEGRHYLVYRTIDECVEHCARLLDDYESARRLRQEAWTYYKEEVEPAAHLTNCLIGREDRVKTVLPI
jgi:hypothetical protein